MGGSLLLQFSIALCLGMVAATFAPSVRRSMPRWFEAMIWVALTAVCWLGVASIKDPRTRELTAAVNWAGGQIFHTLLGFLGASITGTISSHRFAIATAVVILFGADLLALAVISSYRQSRTWQPLVRLRDWMELPAAPAARPPAPMARSGIDELNERLAAATAVAGATAATLSVQFLIWARDVGLPRAEQRLALAVATGRVETKVWLDSVRETAREVEAGARSRFAETTPEVNKLALRVAAILNGVADAEQRITPGTRSLGQVIDIQALRIAQSFGPIGQVPPTGETDDKQDDSGPEQHDQLAS
ncbi:MAG: hypothetical protein M3082_22445 [Candidatus Dormibacteraeota bacterium]|nr:hypothetical protein [Candidatus Dormibacteraeota bacterium]